MQQKVLVMNEYYKCGNCVVRIQRNSCREFYFKKYHLILAAQFEEMGSLYNQQICY
jgi:hypothetical protein